MSWVRSGDAPDWELVVLGQRIRARRNEVGMLQSHLAQQVGLTRSSIANVEAGRQQLPFLTAKRVAGALGTTIGALAGEEPMTAVPVVSVVYRPVLHCSACGDLGSFVSASRAQAARSVHLAEHLQHPARAESS
jgi:DNA-binding XRE family transcriptional regulator